jgi:Fe-S cluster assembly iron-binding protein IscA
MKITDAAKQLLVEAMKEHRAEGIRLYMVAGCCGPQFALSFDEPQESDSVQIISGIRVAVDAQINSTAELTIDKDEAQQELILLGATSCC